MKVIDKLPDVNFRKLVEEPITYIMDVWEFIVVFYTVVNGMTPSDKRLNDLLECYCNKHLDKQLIKKLKWLTDALNKGIKCHINPFDKEIKWQTNCLDKEIKWLTDLLNKEIGHKNLKFTDISHYSQNNYIPYLDRVSNEELKEYLQRYINLYREGKIYGKKRNYKNFANSQEAVYKIIQKFKDKSGDCIIIPIPYETEEDKEIRFFEIIAYLYLNGNIQIQKFSVEEDNKELFLQIRILHDINSLYGITIDKDKNVLYKGKKVDITYKKDEFTLIKELVDNKGKIDKQKFFEQVKWGNNAEKNKNRMNGLKNRVLSKLKKCGAENLKISQAGAYIELKEGEK